MTQTIEESRAQLIANLQQQAEELAQLNRIAIALTSELDLRRLLQMITDAARKVTSAEYAAFFLTPEIVGEQNSELAGVGEREEQAVRFELAAISGASPRVEKHFRRLGQVQGKGVLHPVFWEGTSIVVDDVHNDVRYIGVPRGHIPVRSFLGVQLRTREGVVLGAFLLGQTQPNWFAARHVELIETLGAQAAVAIHNAQLVMRERLAMEAYMAHLEREVHERTAELERRNQQLSKYATDLLQLHHEFTEVQKRQMLAEERGRIGQELHDRVQQTLFTIGLKADWVKERLPADSPLAHQLRSIKQLSSLGMSQLRDAIFALSSAEGREETVIDTNAAMALLERLGRAAQTSAQARPPSAPELLSAQQLVILRLIAQGLSSREIASRLYLSENTVRGYVQEILHRLSVKKRSEAVMVAVKQGWL